MSEAAIQREIIKWLREQGAYVYKAVGTAMAQVGTPDLLVCWQGQMVGIEVKVPGKDATAMQELEMKKIVAAGGRAMVAHSLVEVRRVL